MGRPPVQVNLDWIIPLPPDWRDPLSAYLEGYVAATLEETTLRNYSDLLRPMIRWAVDQKVSFAKFGPRQLDSWSVQRRAVDQVSDRTRRTEVFAMKAFFKFCRKRGYRRPDPLREYDPPKAGRAYVPVPTEDDLRRLLDSVKERWSASNPKMKSIAIDRRRFYSCRDYAIFCMLIETGARIGEILSLELSHYKIEHGNLFIAEAKGDTWRPVPIKKNGQLVKAVSAWLNVRPRDCPAPFLFITAGGEKIGYRGLAKTFGEQIAYANLPKFTLHAIRHYTTTRHGRVNLKDAQQIAGHTDIKTTEIYLTSDPEWLRETHERAAPLDRLFEKEKPAKSTWRAF